MPPTPTTAEATTPASKPRLKIGVALEGGGALGLAHILNYRMRGAGGRDAAAAPGEAVGRREEAHRLLQHLLDEFAQTLLKRGDP